MKTDTNPPSKYAQNDDAPSIPFTAHLFISEEKSKAVFKARERTIDGAALRYSPPSLRGAADDPSLRNQLQQLFLSEGRRQAVKLGTKEPRQLL